MALGTQTVDSVVTPAAYCGVVGFKGTHGRVPVDGVIPFAPSADHVGVIAADVAAARTAAAVIADAWSPATEGEGHHVAVPTGAYLGQVDEPALTSFTSNLADLTAAGWEVSQVPALDDIAAVVADHRQLIAAEFAEVHQTWFEQHGARYRPRTAALIEEGRAVLSTEAAACRERAERLGGTLTAPLDALGADAWVAPAATGVAPRAIDGIGSAVMGLPWTSAHLPTVTIPSGALHGLPLGLQLVGRHGQDEALLAVAAAAERALQRPAAATGTPG
jgi:Asp-tRNA(Asn)/Glu-tRNA(Gln) amidotransferase A subunit family amidase